MVGREVIGWAGGWEGDWREKGTEGYGEGKKNRGRRWEGGE